MMRSNDPMVQVERQIMWNRLIAVAEEQARTLVRASFSTPVREAGDLSAGVFDVKGRMLAQAVTGTPGHVNTMAQAVSHFLKEYPAQQMQPGDVFITNDPWLASGHLHDVTVVSPAFLDGRIVALFAAVAHLVDVGGRGMGPDGRQVFEEGILIPIMPLARGGKPNEDLLRIMRANTREPLQVEGDLHAVIAAGEEGQRRLIEMMREFHLEEIDGLAEYIIGQSREATIRAIAALKPGVYRNSMSVDGYGAPLTLSATCAVAADHIRVDYTGTSPMSRYGINVVPAYTAAYTCFGLKCAIAPEIPNNYGSLEPFVVTAPPGCILHAVRPAPVAARHVIGLMLPDVVLGCFEGVLRSGVPAEGGLMWNPYVRGNVWHDGSRRAWEAFFFSNGGTGARPNKDGLSATAFPAGTRSVQIEAAEAVAPLIIWRKEFRPDSGGAGRHRGGLGQIISIGSAAPGPIAIQAMFDRIEHPARGRSKGTEGAAGRAFLSSGAPIRGFGLQDIPPGEVLHLELPGGGGFGSPLERPVEAVAEDVLNGLVSRDAALKTYGVDVNPADGSVQLHR